MTSDEVYLAIGGLIVTNVVTPFIGWGLGQRRERSSVAAKGAEATRSIVDSFSALVEQLREENDRLASHNEAQRGQIDTQRVKIEHLYGELRRLAPGRPGEGTT